MSFQKKKGSNDPFFQKCGLMSIDLVFQPVNIRANATKKVTIVRRNLNITPPTVICFVGMTAIEVIAIVIAKSNNNPLESSGTLVDS